MTYSADLNLTTASAKTSPTTYQTLAVPGQIKLLTKVVQVSGVRGSTGRGVQFTIANTGKGYLRFGTDAFSFSGTDASQFAIVGGSLPRNVAPGKRASFTVALKASSNASVTRVLTAKLSIKETGKPAAAAIELRGLATTGEGADKEPSLARILELFQYDINDGDTTPDTTFLDLDGSPTDQVTAPRFAKAANGNVIIEPLAQFANRTSTLSGTIGYYDPGTPDSRKTLFGLTGIDAQTVNPVANGPTQFDPGTRAFSMWAEAPTFIDNGQPRVIYGEDALNTWEPNVNARNKVRVYPLKENGKVVANAYVVTFEEYTLQNDQNDYVFVMRNVTPFKSAPELGLIAVGPQPDPDRLALSRVEVPDSTTPNVVYDTGTVRVINTGNKDLVISKIGINSAASSDFQLIGAPSTATLRRNATLDLTVKFIAHSGDRRTGTLTLTTNDRDEPTKNIALSGFWQVGSEEAGTGVSQEPTLQEIIDTLGYRTQVAYAGQTLSNHGKTEAIGDEVLADAWAQADTAKPVYVQELSSYHTQGQSDQIAWYETGHPWFGSADPRNPGATNGPRNAIFDVSGSDGQTLFPHKNFSTDYASGSFTPTGTFGLRVSGEYSDDDINNQLPGDLGGHHFRFFPARDENNNFIPDTFLVVMDFGSVNFDYQDHLLLVRNIKPADRTAAVTGLQGVGTKGGNVLDWADVAGATGYHVLRSDKSGGPYVRISDEVLTTSAFTDTSATKERTRYYRVVALTDAGLQSEAANTSLIRPA